MRTSDAEDDRGSPRWVFALELLAAGALMMLGARAVEYVVQPPVQAIMVCLASDVGEVKICEPFASGDVTPKHQ